MATKIRTPVSGSFFYSWLPFCSCWPPRCGLQETGKQVYLARQRTAQRSQLNAHVQLGDEERQLVIQAVLMALWQRADRSPLILHSDRGCQFTSDEYPRFLKGHNLTCSMSRVGSCADNAAAESFFGVLKRERVNRRRYLTRAEARADVFDYIERFHNPRRRRQLEQIRSNAVTLT